MDKLGCEYDGCNWEGTMRTRCKNAKSVYFKKALCPTHSRKEAAKKTKTKQVTRTESKAKELAERRQVFFDYHISICNSSDESGYPIDSPTRLNICHILPKSYFPSVGEELNNCVYLTGDEHTELDNLIFKNKWKEVQEKFPNTWEVIKVRLQEVIPKVTENHIMMRTLKDYLQWID